VHSGRCFPLPSLPVRYLVDHSRKCASSVCSFFARPAIAVPQRRRFDPAGHLLQTGRRFEPWNFLVKNQGGKLPLTTRVRDSNGAIVVDIIDNKWTVNSSEEVCWDKIIQRMPWK
jgi:hypothetical protein